VKKINVIGIEGYRRRRKSKLHEKNNRHRKMTSRHQLGLRPREEINRRQSTWNVGEIMKAASAEKQKKESIAPGDREEKHRRHQPLFSGKSASKKISERKSIEMKQRRGLRRHRNESLSKKWKRNGIYRKKNSGPTSAAPARSMWQ